MAQDRRDLVVVGGKEHRIRRVLFAGILAAQQVWRGLAAGSQQSAVVVGDAVRDADDVDQRLRVGGRQRRRPQTHLIRIQLGRGRAANPEGLLEQRPDAVREGLGRRGIAPGIPLHRGLQLVVGSNHALQYYRCCQSVTMRRRNQWRSASSTQRLPA
jgi:hypothetical protein